MALRSIVRLLVASLALGLAGPLAAQEFPALSGRVVDEADIIPADIEAEIDAKLAALETQSQRQFVVATIPDLGGYPISDYGYRLGREWGIGDEERDDGVILLVAPNDKKVRIEVGYGAEPVLTDGLSGLIVQNTILPRFRENDFAGGIVAGTDAIIEQLILPEEEARAIAAQAGEQRARSEGAGIPVNAIIWVGFLFFFFILPLLRGKRGRKYRRRGVGGAVGDILLWEAVNQATRGSRRGGWGGGGFGGGFGGGGFGGGGFSGGGGSFGGGGASGGW
ncbi:UPF0603 protein YgcG [Alteripontixanthobacter maritimus]|uniref:UPF0603 protein YgcG n=1 Tax=Alteripontixanthobacter maritimus TaxID=2161824 RepID=A0A369Q8N3_9SPHN|nr:TPM domain-containing protein [Alteripontixanthobacter maritimus]RDC59516.1 UPF0603 protein YgcG [Alteripontixanthobacter maritimus]